MRYYYQITVDGWANDKEVIKKLQENLKEWLRYQVDNVYKPSIFDVGKGRLI